MIRTEASSADGDLDSWRVARGELRRVTTLPMPRNVAIVFEPDFADQLGKLAFHTPVWLVDTPENTRAAEESWQAAIEWPHITVTLFRAPSAEPDRSEWQALLAQIAFQQRSVDSVEVVGARLTPAARAAFTAAGFLSPESTVTGFRFKR
jgi:hypothetical protein